MVGVFAAVLCHRLLLDNVLPSLTHGCLWIPLSHCLQTQDQKRSLGPFSPSYTGPPGSLPLPCWEPFGALKTDKPWDAWLRESPPPQCNSRSRLSHTKPDSDKAHGKHRFTVGTQEYNIISNSTPLPHPSFLPNSLEVHILKWVRENACLCLSRDFLRLSSPSSFMHPRFQRYLPSLKLTMGFSDPELHNFYILIRVSLVPISGSYHYWGGKCWLSGMYPKSSN